MIKRNKV